MAYEDDRASLLWWGKIRLFALVVAALLFGLTLVVDGMQWLHWIRAVAWAVAGYACFQEARAAKKIGQDADAHYLRCVLCVVVAVFCFF